MKTAAAYLLAGPDLESEGFKRAIRWSLAVHVVVLVVLFVLPRNWLTTERVREDVMVIELGGSPGPRSTGMTSIGSRTVQEVAEPTRRAQPIQPNVSAPDVMTIPEREPVRVQPPPPRTERPTTPTPPRPPAPGREVNQGNVAVETGARGQGAGLSFGGGGGTSGTLETTDFCCMDYIELMRGKIDDEWRKDLPERGTTIVRFTIQRSGAISDITIVQSSGSNLLDREAERTLRRITLPGLPTAYTEPTLGIRLTFPYEN